MNMPPNLDPLVTLNSGARLTPFQNLQLPVNAPIEALAPQAPQTPQRPSTEGLWSPERIAREREIAQSLMSTDSGPIYSNWQGLAHVLQNVVGGLQARSANKAEQRGRDYSREIMKELFPSAQGAQGGAGVSAPASAPDFNRLQAVMADPYASPQVKAAAQQQYEMATFERKKQIENQYRQVPEAIQLSRIANDPTAPESERAAARQALILKLDPFVNFSGPDIGTYVGRQSGLGAFLGAGQPQQQQGGPAVGSVHDGFQFRGGDPKDRNNWIKVANNNPNDPAENVGAQSLTTKTVTKAEADVLRAALGSNYGRYMETHGIKVTN